MLTGNTSWLQLNALCLGAKTFTTNVAHPLSTCCENCVFFVWKGRKFLFSPYFLSVFQAQLLIHFPSLTNVMLDYTAQLHLFSLLFSRYYIHCTSQHEFPNQNPGYCFMTKCHRWRNGPRPISLSHLLEQQHLLLFTSLGQSLSKWSTNF